MVTNAMASSFHVHASASQVAAKSSGRYASKTPVESDDDYDDNDDARSNFQSSRYRLMDEQAQRQELGTTNSAFAVSRGSSQRGLWTARASTLDIDASGAAAASSSASFQARVLDELQKLKEAQRRDLDAIAQLQREKERAERKAQQLEAHFRASTRSIDATAHTSDGRGKRSTTLVIDEPSDNDANTDDEGLDFDLSDDLGDESLPPPQYDDDSYDSDADAPRQLPTSSPAPGVLSSPETSPPKWTSKSSFDFDPPASVSPVRVAASRDSRVSSRGSKQQLVQTWDSSTDDARQARTGVRVQQTRASARSRSPSASSRTPGESALRSSSATRRTNERDVQRSCSFFQEKQKAKDEERRLAAEAAERLERAQRAHPPTQLLERQERARRKREAQLKRLDNELHAELSKDKRVRARDVPLSTYVLAAAPGASGDAPTTAAFVTPDELEAQRKARIRERAQQLLESAELPPRMARAASATGDAVSPSALRVAAGSGGDPTVRLAGGVMSVKMKKQLAEAAEEQARKQRMKPKAVPDFDQLHAQWTKRLARSKAGASSSETEALAAATTPRAFFASRAAALDALKAKKAARKQKQLEREAAAQRAQVEAQHKLLAKTRASASKHQSPGAGSSTSVGKPTKADALRVKRVLERLAQSQKQQVREAMDAEVRQQRMKVAAKRVAAQVRASEHTRVDSRPDYVSIKDVDTVAKQRAHEFKQSLRASIAQNKARILGAVATAPSLMERFATDLKREEHKRNALEAVVKNVFKRDLRAMKGILTDDEHALARDIVAAERARDADAESSGGDAGGGSATKPKRSSKVRDTTISADDDDADAYSDV